MYTWRHAEVVVHCIIASRHPSSSHPVERSFLCRCLRYHLSHDKLYCQLSLFYDTRLVRYSGFCSFFLRGVNSPPEMPRINTGRGHTTITEGLFFILNFTCIIKCNSLINMANTFTCLFDVCFPEPAITTSATAGTTPIESTTPLPDATSSYADIGTTQPTFSSKPSTTAGICCQFAVYCLPVYQFYESSVILIQSVICMKMND